MVAYFQILFKFQHPAFDQNKYIFSFLIEGKFNFEI